MVEEQTVDDSQANTEEKSAEEVLYGDGDKKPEVEAKEEKEVEESSEPETEEVVEGEEPKAAEADKSKDEFTLKMPEETLLSESVLDDIASIAKEQGLSDEQAQKFLDKQSEVISNYHEDLETQFDDQVTAWGDEIKADKELGGDNLEGSIMLAKRAVTEFAGEEFLAELDKTGYGNHPQLFRMLTKIGKELSAGDLVEGNRTAPDPKSFADRFYPAPKEN
jgi:hypothetical protein